MPCPYETALLGLLRDRIGRSFKHGAHGGRTTHKNSFPALKDQADKRLRRNALPG
jgi:hypothetical protein